MTLHTIPTLEVATHRQNTPQLHALTTQHYFRSTGSWILFRAGATAFRYRACVRRMKPDDSLVKTHACLLRVLRFLKTFTIKLLLIPCMRLSKNALPFHAPTVFRFLKHLFAMRVRRSHSVVVSNVSGLYGYGIVFPKFRLNVVTSPSSV